MAAVARPYARALMAVPGIDRSAVLASLEAAAAALADPAVAALADNPQVLRSQLAAALAPDQAALGPVVRTIDLLLENGRLDALPSLAAAYAVLKDDAESRTHATVTTAQPLTDTQREGLRQALARRTGRLVELVVEIDKRLLAGVIVQHGDMVLDVSVRGRLAALAQALSPF